jgi:hypothetical protein
MEAGEHHLQTQTKLATSHETARRPASTQIATTTTTLLRTPSRQQQCLTASPPPERQRVPEGSPQDSHPSLASASTARRSTADTVIIIMTAIIIIIITTTMIDAMAVGIIPGWVVGAWNRNAEQRRHVCSPRRRTSSPQQHGGPCGNAPTPWHGSAYVVANTPGSPTTSQHHQALLTRRLASLLLAPDECHKSLRKITASPARLCCAAKAQRRRNTEG